jgi:Mlc titration factor MtfA (ptsG expression regulator)
MNRLGWVFLLLTVSGLALAFLPAILRKRTEKRRRRIMDQPFPRAWEEFLRANWRLYPRLPPDLRQRLQQCLQVLQAEKRFEPCGALLEVTEEMSVLILAQAALLLAGRPAQEHGFYPALVSILVYPGSFRDKGHRIFSLREDESDVRLGESWVTGSVVLSWHSVKRGARGDHDGVNVVFHEFAHQIDQGDGESDGAPEFDDPEDALRWAEVFRGRFEDLIEEVDQGGNPLLDEYGASDPAEFFAVSTETFFEKPRVLQREMPDLYDELAAFYGLDPASWRLHV